MRRFTWITVMAVVMVMSAAVVLAQGTPEKKAAAPAKSTGGQMFLIESPHTPEECLGVMDETHKAKDLEKWSWGCMSGDHTAYRMVKAKDEAAALAMVPASVRGKAKAIPVTTMTPAMLESAHKAHM
jgi:hypothetical protein